jgi:fructose-1,6-bisphosphatase-3
MKEDGTQNFYTPKITTVETLPKRMMVRDSDQGRDLEQQVEDLKELVAAYRSGKLKEVF